MARRKVVRRIIRRTIPPHVLSFLLFLTNVFGVLVSMYAYHVEASKTENGTYEALCDILDFMSCSTVLTSKYSVGFGFVRYILGEDSILNIPNCCYGIFIYSLLSVLGWSERPILVAVHLTLSIVAVAMSLYLALLLFILRNVCLLCTTIYIVSILNLMLTTKKSKLIVEQLSPTLEKQI